MSRAPDTDQRRSLRAGAHVSRLLTIVLVALLVTGSVVATGDSSTEIDAQSQQTDSAFVVALEDDGDANVSITVSFDLTDEADRTAFNALQTNETKREQLEARTEKRFRTVAASTANETGREMTIENPRVSFETVDQNDRGIVSVSATWTELAATDDDRLRLSKPFASGFIAEQPVVLTLPDGYTLAESTPAPADRTDTRITWGANTSLEGYEAVVVPSDTEAESGDAQPGFGLGATAVTVAAAAWLRRQR
ncbi:hypothetical protein [Natrinema sp. HArc-T2]|uniref:DUF7345 domain-containing protein n=1 Tax=Natrinema sp. HArc-T2 TaxID=3242701 RepID=UPI00359E9F7D